MKLCESKGDENMFVRKVFSKILFIKPSGVKFQIFIVTLARVFYLLSVRTPLGDGGGGGI